MDLKTRHSSDKFISRICRHTMLKTINCTKMLDVEKNQQLTFAVYLFYLLEGSISTPVEFSVNYFMVETLQD